MLKNEKTTSGQEQSRKVRKPLDLKSVNIICSVLLVFFSLFSYYFADDSKVRVLACEGNYYYTNKQIYDLANVTKSTRLWLVPSSLMEGRVKKQGMIDKVSVKKKDQSVSFKIEEKFAIGYYIEKGQKKILTIDNESIDVDEEFEQNLYHLPLMTNLKKEQREQICTALKEVQSDLSKESIEKISEIVPFSSSYDDNMIKLVMRDGNSVYSGMESLGMLIKYQLVLTQLRGNSACLVLDSSHNAVDKFNCEDLTTSRKELMERQTACEAEEGMVWDSLTYSCVKAKEKDEDDDQEQDQDEQEDENINQEEVEVEQEDENVDESSIQDWQLDEESGWMYSPSTGYYYSQYSGEYFEIDERTGSFKAIDIEASN